MEYQQGANEPGFDVRLDLEVVPDHGESTGGNGEGIEVSFRQLVSRIPGTTYSVFGLYRYPAKFIPQVVAYVLEAYGQKGMTVIDPFAGGGTTGLVARVYGIHYEMWDLNPLLELLHDVALLEPRNVDPDKLVNRIAASHECWLPSWSRLSYWYPDELVPFLSRVWGFYHSLEDEYLRKLLAIPLLKVTRMFSFNDPQRQKLSRSPRAIERVTALMQDNWAERYLHAVVEEVVLVLKRLQEYRALLTGRDCVKATVKAGVDSLELARQQSAEPSGYDLLVTSPPYLQAQEYIRCSKLDLFWLGYSEDHIRQLSKLELPYRTVEPIPILSETYLTTRAQISEPHLQQMFDCYFFAVISVLEHLARRVRQRMCIFVGPATVRGKRIAIDRILVEHFSTKGWKHEVTLVDTIAARVMFRSRVNPATGIVDERIPVEHLVVLRRENPCCTGSHSTSLV